MKDWSPASAVRWLFTSEPGRHGYKDPPPQGQGKADRLLPRWIFSACAGADLLLRIFLAGISNQRIDRAARHSACRPVFARGGGTIRPLGLLVCADTAVVFKQPAHADGNLLGGNDRIGASGAGFVSAGNAGDLFRMFPVVCER